MSADNDAALAALMLPFANGLLAWPGRALFLRARDGWPLHARPLAGLACEQSWKPAADALLRSGFQVVEASDGARHPLVLALPPRQRDEARALLARAVDQCEPGGSIVASMANDEGARSGESDLKALAALSGSVSKHHCRVFWTRLDPGSIDQDLLARWRAIDAPRPILDGRFLSRPGVFAWDRIDPASALLAAHLPADLAGRGADLGAGWGYLAIEALARCPRIEAIDLYEAEARALELARANLQRVASPAAVDFHWHDVAAGLSHRYDFILSNPPFHAQARADRPDIGRRFIAVAADALLPGGRLYLVANRHLPYESVLDASFGTVRVLAQRGGFKVVEAVRALPRRASR